VPPAFGVAAALRRRTANGGRSVLPAIAGALRRSLLRGGKSTRGSVRRLPGPFTAALAPALHHRRLAVPRGWRVLVPFIARSFSWPGV
jgi:hypothetical protein